MTDGLTLAEAISRSEQARSLRIRPRRASPDTIEFLHALTAAPDVGFDRYRAHVLSLVSGFLGATKLYRWALGSPKASDVSALELYRAALFGLVIDRIPGDTAVLDPASVPLNVAPCEWAEALYWTEIVLDGDIPALAEWHGLRATGVAAIKEIERRKRQYSNGALLYGSVAGNDLAALAKLERRIAADIGGSSRIISRQDTAEIINSALGELVSRYQSGPAPAFNLWLRVFDGRVDPGLWATQRWRDELKWRKRAKRDVRIEVALPVWREGGEASDSEGGPGLGGDNRSTVALEPVDVSIAHASRRLCPDLSELPGLKKSGRVIRAWLKVFDEGIDEPTQKDMAARLGVTERTVRNDLAKLREPQNRAVIRGRLTEGKDTRSGGGWTCEGARDLYRSELRHIHGLVYRRGAPASRPDTESRKLAAGRCEQWYRVGVFRERLRLPVQDGSAGAWWVGLSREQLQTAVAARRTGMAPALAAEPTLRDLWVSTNREADSFPVSSPRVA